LWATYAVASLPSMATMFLDIYFSWFYNWHDLCSSIN
jgi:hypothetical protein